MGFISRPTLSYINIFVQIGWYKNLYFWNLTGCVFKYDSLIDFNNISINLALCQEVRESCKLHLQIQIFYVILHKNFFAYSPIEYESFLNKSIWLIHGTLTGTKTFVQNGRGSNDNESLLNIPHIFRNRASSSNVILCHTRDTHFLGGILTPQKGIQLMYSKLYRQGERWFAIK